MKQTYNWKRFLSPRDGIINLSDRGFLLDPDTPVGKELNPDVVEIGAIVGTQCLVLLGEPGIGKTHMIAAERDRVEMMLESTDADSLWFDLQAYSTDAWLHIDVFAHDRLEEWKRGSHRLYLFLDSLDEGLLSIANLSAQLAVEFRRLPVDRLYLRLTCRTADWPHSLEDELRQIWGESNVGVFELTPLRRLDVMQAATARGVDAHGFVETVDRRGATPFAIKPVTLDFLLNGFAQDGNLPSSKTDLYIKGCLLLCEEFDESRRRARRTALSSEQRLVVAARIAAAMIFGNKATVSMSLEQAEVRDADIPIRELTGYSELVNGIEFEVTEDVVFESLGSGLFSSWGPRRMGWAHQTYAEFLAAHYLVQSPLPESQIRQLIKHPGDPEGRIPPQLQETAAWLATMIPGIFDAIVKLEPDILLRSDVATLTDNDRRTLVDALLTDPDAAFKVDRDLDTRSRFRHLEHDGLSLQLLGYINDGSASHLVRRMAIAIAEACKRLDLAEALSAVALDQNETLDVRVRAAYSVVRMGDKTSMARLVPLALGEAGEDANDELKGCGLMAAWPMHISTDALFQALTPPKQPNLIGAYYSFLVSKLVPHLQESDLSIALRWVEQWESSSWGSSTLRESVTDPIMLKAWHRLEAEGVVAQFAMVAFARLQDYRPIIGQHVGDGTFPTELAANSERRRLLALALIDLIANAENESFWLVHGPTPVVLSDDVLWMIDKLMAETSDLRRRIWALLIARSLDRKNRRQVEAAYEASQIAQELESELAGLFRPVILNSPEAQQMRERHEQWREMESRRTARREADQQVIFERSESLLQDCEGGNLDAWWYLNLTLLGRSDGLYHELEPDLRKGTFWQEADQETRARIIEVARRYVLERDANQGEWLGTNVIYRPAYAGYRALRLLLDEDPGFLDGLPREAWNRWAVIVLAYPVVGLEEEAIQERLISMAYPHASRQIIQALTASIEWESEQSSNLFILRRVEGIRDEAFDNAMIKILQGDSLGPSATGDLIGFLLDREVDAAREFAEGILATPPFLGENSQREALLTALSLIQNAPDAGWPTIWPLVQTDGEFGETLFLTLSERSDRGGDRLGTSLNEDEVAELFIWLQTHFPYDEDPRPEGFHQVSPRESVGRLRDSLLRKLASKGTYEACDAIQKLQDSFPGMELNWILQDALEAARRASWTPPEPSDFLGLIRNSDARLVNSGSQLLEVIVESLGRLQREFQGETPSARDVWDEVEKRKFRPIDEPGLSDYVKRFLERDLVGRGIILNREVEIRRGEGAGQGELTDIHVDAVSKRRGSERFDRICTVVEVKGPWNWDLNRAMKEQLVGRYLKDSQCRSGLYLVGWFTCDQWDADDTRMGRVPKWSLREATEFFDAQAGELSRSGLVVRSHVLDATLR